MKSFKIAAIFFLLLFSVLFAIRLNLFSDLNFKKGVSGFGNSSGTASENRSDRESSDMLSERDTWMNIFQNDHKIGFSHTLFSKKEKGYFLQEIVFMQMNILGMVQKINLKTEGILNSDFTLSEIRFEIDSGPFYLKADGKVVNNLLSINIESSGAKRNLEIKTEKKPYLISGILDAIRGAGVKVGDRLSFDIFDPATMTQETVNVHVISKENIQIMEIERAATKISLNFKGATQFAWIGEDGEVLKEEGLLGIILEKTTREDALSGLDIKPTQDLTAMAAVESNVVIQNAPQLNHLKLEITGISLDSLHEKEKNITLQLDGGRQTLEGNILTITKESLSEIPPDFDMNSLGEIEKRFLHATLFIQSDHERIRNLVKEIVSEQDSPLQKTRKLIEWIHRNIERRPVLSLPDALSTLENRMGDCNEHAVLFAALARAAGIPAKVEAGVVYMNGKFYYHAWNQLYLGEWITADALFRQIPADVTHIRFVSGDQEEQINLMGIIGKIKLKVIE